MKIGAVTRSGEYGKVNTAFKHVHSNYFHIFILYSVLNLVNLANASSASDRKREID